MNEPIQEKHTTPDRQIVWYKDIKLLFGVILVVSTISLGFFSKGLVIAKFYEPFYLITGLSLYAFSWFLLLCGILLVGMETVRMIRQHIQNYIKRTIKETYGFTMSLPQKGLDYTKQLHKKSMERFSKKPAEEKSGEENA